MNINVLYGYTMQVGLPKENPVQAPLAVSPTLGGTFDGNNNNILLVVVIGFTTNKITSATPDELVTAITQGTKYKIKGAEEKKKKRKTENRFPKVSHKFTPPPYGYYRRYYLYATSPAARLLTNNCRLTSRRVFITHCASSSGGVKNDDRLCTLVMRLRDNDLLHQS